MAGEDSEAQKKTSAMCLTAPDYNGSEGSGNALMRQQFLDALLQF